MTIEQSLRVKEQPEKQKFSHSDVEFEHPAQGDNHCEDCTHFIGAKPSRCEIVKGPIEAGDWCEKFSKKLRRVM